MGILAHGGAAGAVAEAAFILIPIGLFAWLTRVSRKRREAEEAAAGETDPAAGPGGDQGAGEPDAESTRS